MTKRHSVPTYTKSQLMVSEVNRYATGNLVIQYSEKISE
jgi:hypothetical protein